MGPDAAAPSPPTSDVEGTFCLPVPWPSELRSVRYCKYGALSGLWLEKRQDGHPALSQLRTELSVSGPLSPFCLSWLPNAAVSKRIYWYIG